MTHRSGIARTVPPWIDSQGRSSWSNELSVLTASVDAVATATPRTVLDQASAPDQSVTEEAIAYRLPAGQSAPAVGDLLFSAEDESYLRRATAVSQSGDRVTVQTEPAALNDAFEDLQFSTEIRLIDVPQTQPSARYAFSGGVVSANRSGTRRQITWPESDLTLIQEEPVAAVSAAGAPVAASSSVSCTGLAGRRVKDFDPPLEVSFPDRLCVAPGTVLTFDVSAAIQAGSEAQYQITQLLFLGLSHPRTGASNTNYGATWSEPDAGNDVLGKGTLRWAPTAAHVDDQLRPYTASFVALAKERAEHCTGMLGLHCKTKRIELEAKITVSWGEQPGPIEKRVVGGNADLSISSSERIDFQPVIRAEADIAMGGLRSGQVTISGPIAFESEVRLQATGAASYEDSLNLLDKRFVKIYWVQGLPIVIDGRLMLDLDYRGEVDAALDLVQTLNVGYEIEAGLEYRNGAWGLRKRAEPWVHYDLSGEAEAHAYVELRFVPDLELAFYDMVTGRLILEPYLYGEAAVEGHFLYRVLADESGVEQGTDADYRFTQLELGGGIDGKFRAGLEVFDKSIIGYPSRDPANLKEVVLVERTPFIGLPKLTPSRTGATRPEDCAIGLTAEVENIPNPFQSLFGGPDSFNPFVEESAAWDVVLPIGVESLEPDDGAVRNAWFNAEEAGSYKLRFSGHSAFGSFVRQYEEIELDFSPVTGCECTEGLIFDRYQPIGDGCGIIRDTHTGLEWKRCPFSYEYVADSHYCRHVGPGWGYGTPNPEFTAPGGFRVPTIDELQTIRYCSSGEKDRFFHNVFLGSNCLAEVSPFPSCHEPHHL